MNIHTYPCILFISINQSMMITVTSTMIQCLLTLVTLSILIIGTFGDGKFVLDQEFKHVPSSSIQHDGHRQERLFSGKSRRALKDSPFRGTIIINEVATTSTPSDNFCPSADWIELKITGNIEINVTGFVLHNNQGPDSNKAYTFPNWRLIPPLFFLICGGGLNYKFSFIFDIDSSDTITLLDSNGDLIATLDIPTGGNETSTYQKTSNGTYMYGYPTPWIANFPPPFTGSIYINEVASTPTPDYGLCKNLEWIELLNAGNETINLEGLKLQVDRGATGKFVILIFSETLLRPGELATYCNDQNYFDVDIGIRTYDAVILLDYYGNTLSTTGALPGKGTGRLGLTYQRTKNNTYMYGNPTPGLPNFPMIKGSIYINEVARSKTIYFDSIYSESYPWIELINIGSDEISLQGFVLHDDKGSTSNETYTFNKLAQLKPGIPFVLKSFFFKFEINNKDTITLLDYNGNVVSTTGVIPDGGNLTSTYQRTSNNTYMYGFPSPYRDNFQTFTGSILINEVSGSYFLKNKICDDQAWVELINTGSTDVDILGFILHDDEYGLLSPIIRKIFTADMILTPGEIFVSCIRLSREFPFYTGITLRDFNGNVISTTGVLPDVNDFTLTYQRTRNNTFIYAPSSQNQENFAPYIGSILINELARSSTRGYDNCLSSWIELINVGNKDVDLSGFILNDDRGHYTYLDDIIMYPGEISVICLDEYYFEFEINSNTITLRDANELLLSTTGVLPNGESPTSTYQRITGTNNTYTYGLPTPGKKNIVTAKVTAPISIPATVPISSPIAPVPVKGAVPTPIAASIPTPSQQVPAPVAPIVLPLPTKQVPLPVSIVAPVSVPLKAPTQQVPLPIKVPIPTQQVQLPVLIDAPVLLPMKIPPQQIPLHNPVPIPTQQVLLPIPVSVKSPTTPVQVPVVNPVTVPTTPNVSDDDCGLFGLFCLFSNECGFLRRLFNIGDC